MEFGPNLTLYWSFVNSILISFFGLVNVGIRRALAVLGEVQTAAHEMDSRVGKLETRVTERIEQADIRFQIVADRLTRIEQMIGDLVAARKP